MPRRPRIDEKVIESTPEKLRIEIDQAFKQFLQSEEIDFTFSHELNNLQRKYIHEKARKCNLISKSYGKEPRRELRITKKTLSLNRQMFYMHLTPEATNLLKSFLNRDDFNKFQNAKKTMEHNEKNFCHLPFGLPCQVTPAKTPSYLTKFRESLPTHGMKQHIIDTIQENQITIISSETGSGKSTQIPQYILDDYLMRNDNCKIICAQPRRISAVSVAERVAEERGQKIGLSVGYHIKLESKMSQSSNLIYVTNGVLVRTVMFGQNALKAYTHIIIDEVHERDKLTDFLLICLREMLLCNTNLKLLLMSATLNVQKFSEYFGNVKVIEIPGRLFKITEYFLDDILPKLNYKTSSMLRKLNEMYDTTQSRAQHLDVASAKVVLPEADMAIEAVIQSNNLDSWSQLMMHLYEQEIPVNYQHSVHGINALMAAAFYGNCDIIEQLIQMGAALNLKCSGGKTALDLSIENQQDKVQSLLTYFLKNELKVDTNEYDVDSHLLAYDMTTQEEIIDYDIITKVLLLIHSSYEPGAILIFLPGYDDIMTCNDRILDSNLPKDSFKIFFLHGSMSIHEQHEVFKHFPKSKRKIILATNIAETSLTIDDVVYVIDSGKAKEKTYDAYSGMGALQTQWISKACIKQRTGRAGRTSEGFCFHIYTKQRYDSFESERIPEILRVPLEELCLHTKSIIKNEMRIDEFLEKAPNPPSANSIKVAVESLQSLGALDENELLTPLGEYLGQLTIEPHLGKMLIYSIIFKCLDPIITLAASMTYKDPFQLPPQANLRTKAAEKRKSLTNDVLSDHLIYMRAFSEWQEHFPDKHKDFCKSHFINNSAMEMILQTRSQLLSQLRAAGFITASQISMANLNVYSKSWPMVKAIICCGLYPKIAFPIRNTIQTRSEKNVAISTNSCLYKTYVDNFWFMYDEMMKVKLVSTLRGLTAITPITVPLLCGNECVLKCSDTYEIDGWLELETTDCRLIVHFREVITSVIKKLLRNPANVLTPFENDALVILEKVLGIEEKQINLKQAHNFGSKPKYFGPRYRQFSQDSRTLEGNGDSGYITNSNPNSSRYRNGNGYHQNQKRFPNQYQQNSSYIKSAPSTSSPAQYAFPPSSSESYSNKDPVGHYIIIRAMTVGNMETAYKNCRWVCSPSTEKALLSSNYYGESIYLVFYVSECDSLAGIARLVNYEIFEGRRNLAILEWIYKNVVIPVNKCPLLTNWMIQLRARKLGQLDGAILTSNVVFEIYNFMSENVIQGTKI